MAATLGFKAGPVQEHDVNWDDAGCEKVGTTQLSRPMGFTYWAFEFEAQEQDRDVFSNRIHVWAVTSSNMGTFSLAAGFKLAQKLVTPTAKVVSIDTSGKVEQSFDQVL